MTYKARVFTNLLIIVTVIALTSFIFASTTNAQSTSPEAETTPSPPESSPEITPETTPESNPEITQSPSYIGFGGVIGLQGRTTSLSEGSFSLLTKRVLTKNLAIHNANTIFGSSVTSSSVALTYNRPISSDGLPIVFTPFLGGGVMIDNENGARISPHLTGGVDVSTPLKVTGTIRINAGFVSDRQADVGVLFGLGFKF
jgi:hypothetical protein